MPLHLREHRPDDTAAVEALVRQAFGEEGPAIVRMLQALRRSDAVRVAHVAIDTDDADAPPGDDGQPAPTSLSRIVGFVQLNRSWIDARRALVEVAVLSPLAVAPDRQGRGIGTALVAAALDWARGTAIPAVLLEGDPGYYGRLGFERASAHGIGRPSARIPDAACQVVLTGVLESWMTGRLIYVDAFWSTDCVGLRDPLLAERELELGS